MSTSLPDNHFYHDLMNRLLGRLDYIRINPTDIVNYGLHTTHSNQQLQQRYHSANITAVYDLFHLNNCVCDVFNLAFIAYHRFVPFRLRGLRGRGGSVRRLRRHRNSRVASSGG